MEAPFVLRRNRSKDHQHSSKENKARKCNAAIDETLSSLDPPPFFESATAGNAGQRAADDAGQRAKDAGQRAPENGGQPAASDDGESAPAAAPWLDGCHWRLPASLRVAAVSDMGWDSPRMPASCDPQTSSQAMKSGSDRGARKRAQVDEFAMVLPLLFDCGAGRRTVVDCGCGSGNLLLPLAARFPIWDFVGLELKPHAVALLIQRAADAGLGNVTAFAIDIDAYYDGASEDRCDAVVALHACGGATDASLRLAARAAAPFAMSPCCLGKLGMATPQWQMDLGVSPSSGAGAQSTWLSKQLFKNVGGFCDFAALAACADGPDVGTPGGPDAPIRAIRARRAKTVIELDRLAAFAEGFFLAAGASAGAAQMGRLLRMRGMNDYAKTDMLVSPTRAVLESTLRDDNVGDGLANYDAPPPKTISKWRRGVCRTIKVAQ